jgi:hypothetical protein
MTGVYNKGRWAERERAEAQQAFESVVYQVQKGRTLNWSLDKVEERHGTRIRSLVEQRLTILTRSEGA